MAAEMMTPPRLSEHSGLTSVKACWPKQMHGKEWSCVEVEHLWKPVG